MGDVKYWDGEDFRVLDSKNAKSVNGIKFRINKDILEYSNDGLTWAVTTPNTTYDVATTSANGLMSSADKVKLNGIEAGSQKNIMTSADKTKLDGIETGAEKNNVTSTDIENWNNKVDKVSGKQLSTNDYTTVEKNKLEGIEVAAQKNTVTSVQGRTGAVTISKSDVGLGSVNNVAITAAQVTKLNELNYNRAMTEAQYEALSQTEKDRSDVWYGIYKE